jgi:hypothetical protein
MINCGKPPSWVGETTRRRKKWFWNLQKRLNASLCRQAQPLLYCHQVLEGRDVRRCARANNRRPLLPSRRRRTQKLIYHLHFNEIHTDEVFVEEAFAAVSENTLPEHLRQLAIQARTLGNLQIGPYLDLIARRIKSSAENDSGVFPETGSSRFA